MSGQSTAHPLAGRLAAPSFVLPGTVAENARFLSGRVDEMALCFFEAQACLKYGENDLPPDLAEPSESGRLRCHVHLPVDLPWRSAPEPPICIRAWPCCTRPQVPRRTNAACCALSRPAGRPAAAFPFYWRMWIPATCWNWEKPFRRTTGWASVWT